MRPLLSTLILAIFISTGVCQTLTDYAKQYPCANKYCSNIIITEKQGKYRLFDKDQEKFITLEFSLPCGQEFRLEEVDGKMVCTSQASWIYNFIVDGKIGALQLYGDVLIPPEYDEIIKKQYDEGECLRGLNLHSYWLLRKGTECFFKKDSKSPRKINYTDIAGFWGMQAVVKKGEEWVFVDTALVESQKPVWGKMETFKKYCKEGAISHEGELVVDFVWDDVGWWWKYFRAEKEGKIFILDSTGVQTSSTGYDEILSRTFNGKYEEEGDPKLYITVVGDKKGLMNEYGKEILKPEYQHISKYKDGKSHVQKDGKWFYVDKEGKVVL